MNNYYTKLSFLFFIFLIFFSAQAQNRALNFDGVNDLVQTTYSGLSGNSSRTVEAWVKTTANCNPSAGGVQQVIVDWGTFINTQRFTVNLLWSNALRIEVGGNGLSGTIAVNDGIWHHVAVVYNSALASNQYSLYVDGVLDVSGNLTVATNTGTSINLRIGQRVDGVNNFEGEIDEVRVYNFPKTMAQVIADKDNELCSLPAGLVAYYKLNEGIPNGMNASNTTVLDYSGNGNNGSLSNFTLNGTSSNWTNGPLLNPADSYSSFNSSACTSYTSPSGLNTWTSNGIYNDVIPNASGCDSVMTINLTIGDASSSINPSACNSYTSPNGDIYTSSANFIDTLFGASSGGCDSIITINLTIGTATSFIDTTACENYTSPSGQMFTSSAIFNDTLVNASSLGCDSIISIDLTVAFLANTNADLVSCEDSIFINGTWYFANQNVVINDFTYLGCDSIHTIDLSFSSPTFEAVNVSSCGTYTSPLGQTFNSSSIFAETYTTSEGCDSVIQYTLTVNNSSSTNNSLSACDSIEINNIWYYTTQTVTNVYSDNNGCDSTVITNLDFVEIDNSVITGGYFTASAENIPGATYVWYNCTEDTIITSANSNQLFISALDDDYYKVEISLNGCSIFSECVFLATEGIEDLYNTKDINIHPNPNTGYFKVSITEDNEIENYEIINIIGKTMISDDLNSSTFYINEELPKGLYFIKVNSKSNSYLKQFIVR